MVEVQDEIKASLRTTQESESNDRADVPFSVGDRVWLSAKHIGTQRPSKKMDWKHLGLYLITEKIEKVAFHLKLPQSMKVHNIFDLLLLSQFKDNEIPGRSFTQPPPVVTEEGEEEYEAEAILDSRIF